MRGIARMTLNADRPDEVDLSEPPFNKKFRLCWCARGVNRLFEPDHRVLVFALTI